MANDDALADKLIATGKKTGEPLWRLPLGEAYDRDIDSPAADVKNIAAGRGAGSIIGGQFLARFVGETAWAHLDIAGTGMGSPQSDINKSWGSGFGVRLLERSGALLVERFPVSRDYATGRNGTAPTTTPVHYLATSNTAATYTSYGGGTNLTPGIPAAAEIMERENG
jgi:hypothetical protein